MPTILVGDTNIWLDLREGGLLEGAFSLPVTYAVPDLLFEDELADFEGPDLVRLGLAVKSLTEAEIQLLEELAQTFSRPSRYDLAALALALSHRWILLSGDAGLRQAAGQKGCEVHGTLWLMRMMVKHRILSQGELETTLETMRRAGRRLPRL